MNNHLDKNLLREEKRQFKKVIQEQSKEYQRTLNDDLRIRLMCYHALYKFKFKESYPK